MVYSWYQGLLTNYAYFIEKWSLKHMYVYIDGLVQERCNSSALAMELRLSCTNPSI